MNTKVNQNLPFDSSFESEYIRRFAEMVRGGIKSAIFAEGIRRVQEALSKIPDSGKKKEALDRLDKISNYGFIHIENPKGSQTSIANKIDELASFVSTIKLVNRLI